VVVNVIPIFNTAEFKLLFFYEPPSINTNFFLYLQVLLTVMN